MRSGPSQGIRACQLGPVPTLEQEASSTTFRNQRPHRDQITSNPHSGSVFKVDTVCLRVSNILLDLLPFALTARFDFPIRWTRKTYWRVGNALCFRSEARLAAHCSLFDGHRSVRPRTSGVRLLEMSGATMLSRGRSAWPVEKESHWAQPHTGKTFTVFLCFGSLTRHAKDAPHDSPRLSFLRFDLARHVSLVETGKAGSLPDLTARSLRHRNSHSAIRLVPPIFLCIALYTSNLVAWRLKKQNS